MNHDPESDAILSENPPGDSHDIPVFDPSARHQQWGSTYISNNPNLFFRDGIRRIDYVLVYDPSNEIKKHQQIREVFLNVLVNEGLEYEIEDCDGNLLGTSAAPEEPSSQEVINSLLVEVTESKKDREHKDRAPPSSMDRYKLRAQRTTEMSEEDLAFVKLYAPWATMARYAELLTLRKPLSQPVATARKAGKYSACLELDPTIVKPFLKGYTCPFSVKRQYLFDIPEDCDAFFTAYERALVLDYILRRARCGSHEDDTDEIEEAEQDMEEAKQPATAAELDIGLTKLISDGVIKAAYPLHELSESVQRWYADSLRSVEPEGTLEEASPISFPKKLNNRTLLMKFWASYKCFAKRQPMNYIRYYFGESIAFYFAWLGFYTAWLGPVAIIGLIVFLLGILGIFFDPLVSEVCESGKDYLMCPLCMSSRCKFWYLNASCFQTKLTRLIDNEGTVCFGIVMALWAVLFLEMWKRRESTLAYRWNVHTIEPVHQPPRPEFMALLQKGYPKKKNPISNMYEPDIPFWRRKVPFLFISYSVLLFGVILTLAALVGIILYKLVIKTLIYRNPNQVLQSMAGILTTVSGSVIQLIFIYILKLIYDRIAVKMNDMEHHRTQLEYDNSLVLKLYMLQFVNYYSSVFYIAFIQGNTAATPGFEHSIVQSTGCDQGDCLFELFLQLIIIMVGKQALSFVQETLMPILLRLFYIIWHRIKQGSSEEDDEKGGEINRDKNRSHLLACLADYTLLDPGSRPLFNEYLELMIQFGFITMFVPAFPLAPFFGLLNNLFEIRGDAKKFVSQYRRPVLERVKTIGIWLSILNALSALAIRTNACVIAFTTQFIDRWVYRSSYSPDGTVNGFKNFTLSLMLTSNFKVPSTEQFCRYDDYRNPPTVDHTLSRTIVFYHVLAAKFMFLFVFECIAILLTSFIAYIIPDVPKEVKTDMHKEVNMINRIIMQKEKKHIRSMRKLRGMLKKSVLSHENTK